MKDFEILRKPDGENPDEDWICSFGFGEDYKQFKENFLHPQMMESPNYIFEVWELDDDLNRVKKVKVYTEVSEYLDKHYPPPDVSHIMERLSERFPFIKEGMILRIDSDPEGKA